MSFSGNTIPAALKCRPTLLAAVNCWPTQDFSPPSVRRLFRAAREGEQAPMSSQRRRASRRDAIQARIHLPAGVLHGPAQFDELVLAVYVALNERAHLSEASALVDLNRALVPGQHKHPERLRCELLAGEIQPGLDESQPQPFAGEMGTQTEADREAAIFAPQRRFHLVADSAAVPKPKKPTSSPCSSRTAKCGLRLSSSSATAAS